ncbi:MAG TPA: ribonuclease P protein component [Candidatus Magasanikbacteria bacterium]|nr:ribonuclease P protein component [Candidatus Magasanikbacteria bacterium]
MLPRENRLKLDRDFKILFTEGKFVSGNLMNAQIWKINPEKYPKRNYSLEDLKIGFVVSKKLSKSAVIRNKIKRQMREIVRLILKKTKLKKGYFLLILAKKEILEANYLEIEKSLEQLLKKVKLL